ncbi:MULTISPECIES: GAF domain-containing protein [Rufibacter]|uniref:GAF domain-containing protein n=1 Tax=Rufibacter quisquiliarum TaxID=1549639 RepID=A0A839GR35_9BACT|nr:MULTISPECIES: GAF domain-containing protein [Rufibacter]MBA9076301.1 GAF domain-containing protein [Rufibacter quisquiliarum]
MNIIPENDQERLTKLHEYRILDTNHPNPVDAETEGTLRHVVSLAAHLFKVPVAMISFVDRERVWLKAQVGLDGITEVDRGSSLSGLAILNENPTVFPDALEQPSLLANPFVAGEFGLRFYAAAPLRTHDGFQLGAVCLVDREPRTFSLEDQLTLKYLANLVMEELELWKYKAQLREEGYFLDTLMAS